MAKKEEISIRELGRRLNVNESAVRKAIKTGKLDSCYDYISKRIDYKEVQKTAWFAEQMVVVPKAGVSAQKAVEKISKAEQKQVKPKKTGEKEAKTEADEWVKETFTGTQNDAVTDISENIDEIDTLIKDMRLSKDLRVDEAIKNRQILGAALEKIELMEKRQVLVKRADVEKALYAAGSQLKKALQGLPDRIVDDVRAAPGKVDALNIIKHNLNLILSKFSEGEVFRNMGAS